MSNIVKTYTFSSTVLKQNIKICKMIPKNLKINFYSIYFIYILVKNEKIRIIIAYCPKIVALSVLCTYVMCWIFLEKRKK